MATFSPSPAPRRSTRLNQRPNSPGRPGQRTSQAAGSRLATPSRLLARNVHSSYPSSPNSMDVDDVASLQTESNIFIGETVFAKTDELAVSFYANLPVEVKQVLKNADFFKTAYMGGIDTVTGFAVVASSKTCFVWQHAQAIKGTPTCYIFSCPPESDYLHPPFHALVPHHASREPGLILVSQSGQIRFWDSIGIGLAGGENYATSELTLRDEYVTNLVRVDSQVFIASTSGGSLHRLVLTSTGGKYHLTPRVFSRPVTGRSLSNLLPSFLGSSSVLADHNRAPQYIRSVTLGLQFSSGEREIWVLGEERIQKWVMKTEGWEEKVLDQNISESIRMLLQDSPYAQDTKLDLELLDLVVNGDDKFVLLVSYAGKEETGGLRRFYALAQLELVGKVFAVHHLTTVPYQNTSAPTAPVAPRIQLLFSGSLVSVEFGDTVAFCAQNSDYLDRLQIKSLTDRTLGVGVSQSTDTLLVLTATTMMQVQLSLDKIRHFDAGTGRANLIKSIMMQAITYGSSPENPLQFSFPPQVDEESLMRGAEQLSTAILQSDPEVVRRNQDLTAQLTSRKERLSWLIGFINENSVLVKMSQWSRQKLATDAEKLYACHHLWLQFNDLLAISPAQGILVHCVHSYMAEVGETDHEDLMRAFFRLRVGDIGSLLKKVIDVTTLSSRQTGKDTSSLLAEANRIVVVVLRSAFDYRAYNLGVYGVQLPIINSWTSRPAIIDVVLSLFDATTKIVDATVENSSIDTRNNEPGSQLPDLASLLFECINERLSWLASPAAANEPTVGQDMEELEQRFILLRPEVLETLRRCGHHDAAFSLAEKYQDFASLVALCHRNKVYPPENNPHAARIQSYITRYKDSFTHELYQWYIQHGELRIMFSQDTGQNVYIDRFFVKKPNPGISWLHDIGNERYGSAASALLEESGCTNNLQVKHLMLSIGKLTQLAQLHETNEAVNEDLLDAFHDELDFVSVHDALLREFRSALAPVRGRHSLESQIDIIMSSKASVLSDKTALAKTFRDLVKYLLQGRALSVEDAVDLLTLKDNTNTVTDYATALHLLASAQNIPEARKLSAFRSTWRRIYLHDNWNAIGKTANISDAEINDRFRSTALYPTLCAVLARDLRPAGYETTPNMALAIPPKSEIASRWPGISDEQVDAIIEDYNLERDRLGELELEDVYHRVRELAVQDTPW